MMATLRLTRIEYNKKHDIPPKRLTIILDGILLLKISSKTKIFNQLVNWKMSLNDNN